LPIQTLDVMVGSLCGPSLPAMGSSLTVDDQISIVDRLAKAGLAPATTLSVAIGLPGETTADAVRSLAATVELAARQGAAAVRVGLWCGDGPPPANPGEQEARFRSAHPDWTEKEYRDLYQVVAALRLVAPKVEVVGPGFLPEWD